MRRKVCRASVADDVDDLGRVDGYASSSVVICSTEVCGVDQARAIGSELGYECIVACPSTRRLQWRKQRKIRRGGDSGDVCVPSCINRNVCTIFATLTSEI